MYLPRLVSPGFIPQRSTGEGCQTLKRQGGSSRVHSGVSHAATSTRAVTAQLTLYTRVKGKLPGNIDLIIRGFANQRSGYVHDILLEWFEEYQSTIINLRILGVDKVGPLLLISDMGGPLTTCAVYHHGLRTHQILVGDGPHKFLPWGYPERAAVSPSQSSPATTS